MKKLIFTFTIILLCLMMKAQTPYYYYYQGEKQYLSLDTEYAFLSLKEQRLPDDIQQRYSVKAMELRSDPSAQKQYQGKRGAGRFYTVLHFEEKMSDEQYIALLSEIKRHNKDVIIAPYFRSSSDSRVGLSNFFYVKLKEEKDTVLLKKMAAQTKSIIIEQNRFRPLSFLLSTTEFSVHNAMECANVFYESGLFQAAEPDLMVSINDRTAGGYRTSCYQQHNYSCVNDPDFSRQWGLKNLNYDGNYDGIDIKACKAWQLSTGKNVTVAIIDDGIKMDHVDLVANMMHHLSYDTDNGSSPQVLKDDHGTRCAGIVGALQNNGEGISGVAPDCRLMSISSYLHPDSIPNLLLFKQRLADGIDWARQNGADVISCSWTGSNLEGYEITDAIDNAVMLGRDGYGCVVVFSAGNMPEKPSQSEQYVCYPATLSNVMAVGAIDCEGYGLSTSRFGNALNVMAPGLNIYTTGWDGIYTGFNNTSAACPHVSGIAALILSVKPELTWQQVRYAIESTCQKVGGYNYNYNDPIAHPNGSWNEQMGYGLVDAYAAVHSVLCSNHLPIVSGAITQNTVWDTTSLAVGTITIHAGATLTITSTVQCENLTNFVVNPGGKLIIDGGTLTAACPGKLWQGIVVLGDSYLPQTAQNQGTVELINNAVIEHAICAIRTGTLRSNTGNSLSGGIIKATNSTFRNNLQAITYGPYENKNSNNVIIDNVGKFTNCTFVINGSNRFAANGVTFQEHVRLYGVRGVTFESCTFENNPATPRVGKGIYSMNAGFKITNRCPGVGFPGYVDCTCPIQNNLPSVFSNHNIGVHSESDGGTPRSIHIDQSKFDNNTTGVRMNAQPNFRLTRCKFTNIHDIGLAGTYSSGYRIEENEFYKATLPFQFIANGILVLESGIAENRIYKNTFENLDRGIFVIDVNGSYRPSGLQFICNKFKNNYYDINIAWNAIVRSHQGSSSAGADNTFAQTRTSSFHSQNPSSAQTINYYYNPGSPNYLPYNPTSNVILHFAAANPCTTTFCTPGGGHRSDLSTLEQYIAMQAQYDQLLAALGENPEILQQLLVLSDAMRELSDNAISGILHDSVIYVDVLKSWYEVVRTPIAKYWLAEVYASESNYEQSEAILRAIPPAFDFFEPELIEHDNYMQFHHFKKYMLLSGRNWTLLDESEIAQLQRIAEATKGRSAGMAKGALCFFFDICYEDEFEGEGQGEEEKAEGEKAEGKKAEGEKSPSFGGTEGRQEGGLYELSIYPNPTPSEMMVSLNNPAVKIVRMEVYDMTSRKVHQQIVNQSSDTLRLNELERGVYILKVYLDQGDMVIRKVVKQ